MKKNIDESGEIKRFWDEYSKIYDEENVSEWDIDIQQIKKHIPTDKSTRILDAGGGTGRITLPLAKMGYHITLCDISSGMLEIARRKLYRDQLLDNVEMIEVDIADLPFKNEVFDFVIFFGAEPDNLKDAVRVLKRGDKIFIAFSTNFKPSPRAIALGCGHVRSWKIEEILEIVYKNGVKPIVTYAPVDVSKFSGRVLKAIGMGDKKAINFWLDLSEEKSAIEKAESLVLVGEKIR